MEISAAFSIATANSLFESACDVVLEDQTQRVYRKKGTIVQQTLQKDVSACTAYIQKYFYPLSDGTFMFFDFIHNKFVNYDKACLQITYFNKLPKPVQQWFFSENPDIYYRGFKIDNNRIYEKNGAKFINEFPGFKHVERDITDDEQKGIEVVWNHVKNVLCSGDEELYQYTRKWFSHVANGRKMRTALLFISKPGSGKGTFTEFFYRSVLGMDLVHVASDVNCLSGRFNGQLFGKMMLVLEEMRAMSINEWKAVNEKLKNLITDGTTNFEFKGKQEFIGDNYLSIIINSNNKSSVKLDENDRRYVVLEVSESKIGDYAYFDAIRKHTTNEAFAEAFFNDCRQYAEQHKTFFEDNGPKKFSTQMKKDIIIHNLDTLYDHIKTEYILKKRDMDIFLSQLTDDYNTTHNKYQRKARDVSKLLKDIGINGKASTGNKMRYRFSHTELYNIFKAKNFIDEFDEFTDGDEEVDMCTDVTISDSERSRLKKCMDMIQKRDDEIEQLKKQIEALKCLIPKSVEEPEETEEIPQPKPVKKTKKAVKTSTKETVDQKTMNDDFNVIKMIF